MSYSIIVSGPNVSDVRASLEAQFATICVSQPIHWHDRKAAVDAAVAFAALLTVSEGEHIKVMVTGSLSWRNSREEPAFSGAGVSVSASVVNAV